MLRPVGFILQHKISAALAAVVISFPLTSYSVRIIESGSINPRTQSAYFKALNEQYGLLEILAANEDHNPELSDAERQKMESRLGKYYMPDPPLENVERAVESYIREYRDAAFKHEAPFLFR